MEEKLSATEKLLSKGKILEAWPLKEGAWALSITPTPSIDKVKFSFFRKGTKGKGFDVYVDGIVFLTLIDELRRRDFNIADKWEYKTGKSGNKQVTVEKGQKALLAIHGFGGTKDDSATVGINRRQATDMLILWQMFFKKLYEDKWEKAFTLGQSQQYTKEEAEAAEGESTTAQEDTNEPSEVYIEALLGDDIKVQGKFRSVSVFNIEDHSAIGRLWVEDENIALNFGETIKGYAEVKGDNYKLTKTA